ncbi:NACHT domain-containing protein [Streptomyces sp. NBC_00081]|uniref:NACHT domain-containing protein n=1 Tax=Streptomyces sp. NBC_00081 TaxID=2975646 RepID=UPI003093D18A|nr:NACHT domain-containing protein [Streptomyces sp. NBC_01397]
MNRRKAGWLWAFVCVVAVATVAAWGLQGLKRGDVDPVGAAFAFAGLVVAGWSGWLSWQGLRHQESDAVAMAGRLAQAVLRAETDARAQLLGGDGTTIDVRFRFRPAAARDAAGAALEGRLSEVVSYYRQLRPGRLVITGAPGSGKTVLALELLLALLEERKPEDPVPVRLPLASWDTLPVAHPGTGPSMSAGTALDPGEAVQVIRAWVCRHLSRYRISPTTAEALMDAGLILPVLDGLDEMDAGDTPGYGSRARQALDVLNAFQRGRAKAGLVLTCRSGQYRALEALEVWAKDAVRVEISQISPDQARLFIQRRVGSTPRWQGVLETLGRAPSSPLARALSTPWRLTVAVTVHEQRDLTGAYLHSPQDLLGPALGTDRAIRDYLLELFLQDATARHRNQRGGTYTPAQVRAWLGVLAAYLNTNAVTGRTVAGRTLSGTDLVLHELWPLAGSRPRIVHAALLAVMPLGVTALYLWTDGPTLLTGLFIALALLIFGLTWSVAWPEPSWAAEVWLRTPQDRRTTGYRIQLWLVNRFAPGFWGLGRCGWGSGVRGACVISPCFCVPAAGPRLCPGVWAGSCVGPPMPVCSAVLASPTSSAIANSRTGSLTHQPPLRAVVLRLDTPSGCAARAKAGTLDTKGRQPQRAAVRPDSSGAARAWAGASLAR